MCPGDRLAAAAAGYMCACGCIAPELLKLLGYEPIDALELGLGCATTVLLLNEKGEPLDGAGDTEAGE